MYYPQQASRKEKNPDGRNEYLAKRFMKVLDHSPLPPHPHPTHTAGCLKEIIVILSLLHLLISKDFDIEGCLRGMHFVFLIIYLIRGMS